MYERGIAARWRMKAGNDELDDLLDRVDVIAAGAVQLEYTCRRGDEPDRGGRGDDRQRPS
ncbi:hypothetical protein [Nocardia sp. NPDC004711]